MSKEDPIILVKHISKRYQIGMDRTYKTFCESITDTIKSPLKRLKSFGRQEESFWALKDVNFEVNPGEVVGIIGRNGAGKTTLLKVLSRITHPTEGEIILRGRVGSLLEVGTGFHPELTGRENIYFNGSILGMTKQEIEAKFDEIVKFAEVEEFLDTPVKRYSSGMQVRLGFAVAAHLEPEILLVDEVLAVGDYQFQKKCIGKMKDVAKGGRTVLFVSHNMGAITRLCERALLLDGGELIADGTATEVAEQYQSAYLTTRSHWERPESLQATSEFLFIAATARDENGKPCSVFRGDQAIHIEVVYDVGRAIPGCYVGASLTNSMGVQVLHTLDTDSQNVGSLPRAPGRYRATFVIPGHLLAAGQYTVSLGAHRPRQRDYDGALDAIVLEVSLVGSLQSLDGTRRTIVTPLFMWQTELESSLDIKYSRKDTPANIATDESDLIKD